MNSNFAPNLSLHQRFLMAATLMLLLFGLAAHSFPTSLREYATLPQEESGASNLNLCLVYQLQTGIHQPQLPALLSHDIALHVSDQLALNLLEFVFPVFQPPIA